MASIIVPTEAEWAILRPLLARLQKGDAVIVEPSAARAVAEASGVGLDRMASDVDHDFDGSYDVQCDVCREEDLGGLSGERLRDAFARGAMGMREEAVAKAFGIEPGSRGEDALVSGGRIP